MDFQQIGTTGTGYITNGNMWGHPHAARAKCDDGKIRTVRLNQAADTAFTWRGRASIKSKTITGYITSDKEGIKFNQYKR